MTLTDTPLDALPQRGERCQWGELYGSALAQLLAGLAPKAPGPLLLLVSSVREADRLRAELTFFGGKAFQVLSLPDNETLPYDPFSPHPDIVADRLRTLSLLPGLRTGIVVTTPAALHQRFPPAGFIAAHAFDLREGQRLDQVALRDQLTRAGYVHVTQVLSPGEYAIRGSVIDLFPAGVEEPFRIDLFDDEIESIRRFDPSSQRSTDKLAQISLLPAREFPTSADSVAEFRSRWRQRFEGDPQRCPVYRAISDGQAPAGVENWLPLFFASTATLDEFLPASTVLVDAADLLPASTALWQEIEERYEQRRHDIERPLLPPVEAFADPAPLLERLQALAWVSAGQVKVEPLSAPEPFHNFHTEPAPDLRADPRSSTPLQALADFAARFSGRILVAADSPGRREVLLDLVRRQSLELTQPEDWQAWRSGEEPLAIVVAPEVRGLLLPAQKLALITEEQLFGSRARQEGKRRRAERDPQAILRELSDLAPGAPVVHEEYGVGRYLGLRLMQVQGHPAEFLVLEYAGGDKLYVPVHALDRVHRYTGGSADTAPLHRLGSEQWTRARRRAAAKLRDVAAELLDLYSRRAARTGHALAFDEREYLAFASAFPFEETVDQQAAIATVLQDLREGKPMDRVICGDVGFGKTEVALRACFAAVQGGKQVAVLVPTTLLAQQHAQNFADRFADWPVRVESLSRFRSPSEQKQVLAGLAAGAVDVVIGTHRLLQRDVAFHDLGLVIVDEEHRFGVRHKERLKAMRADVDLLTLTATPIPRTLNMALGGLRDLSLITTAPAERVAIETFVCEWSDVLIREACLREIRRGGQIYFVHNAVEDIEAVADRLRQLVPEAGIRTGHGQMRERELEQLMLDFYHRRFDLLVCTTIIESGIDVPTANTILIDRADRFGLAQLHQLRGRVGRSHHRAYAYLMAPPLAALPADAVKRLEAIEALEDLGAGFTLATHDLEIRGAGELLGEGQSGQIQEIGFNLYLELLDRAVQSLREGNEPDLEAPLHAGPEVELQLPALLPDDYMPDVHLRLRLYKRIASCSDATLLEDLRAEMIDRFGPLPPPALTLFQIQQLKLRAVSLGLKRLEIGASSGVVRFADQHCVDPSRVITLIQHQPDRYRLDGSHGLRLSFPADEDISRVARAERVLNALGASA